MKTKSKLFFFYLYWCTNLPRLTISRKTLQFVVLVIVGLELPFANHASCLHVIMYSCTPPATARCNVNRITKKGVYESTPYVQKFALKPYNFTTYASLNLAQEYLRYISLWLVDIMLQQWSVCLSRCGRKQLAFKQWLGPRIFVQGWSSPVHLPFGDIPY